MTKKPILIVGSGISGLSVARLLRQHGISCIVFEQSTPEKSQGYAITVRDWAFEPLLSGIGGISVKDFQKGVAVDRELGGTGWVDLTFRNNGTGETLFNPEHSEKDKKVSLFRANRGVLRDWLGNGVDIRYDHKLKAVQGRPGNVKAVFENNEEVEGSILIAADGVHSSVRQSLLPHVHVQTPPVILFHGKRRMTVAEWHELWSAHIGESTIGAGVGDDFNTFVTVANATKDGSIDLDWTYSRTRDGERDPLWMPDRGEIVKAPQHLLKEIRSKDLVPPFSTLVNADDIKKSKVYNWRIWVLQVQRKELDKAAESGIVFIGDAVHAMPIFGGEGGNHAMLDAVELSAMITEKKTDLSDTDVAKIIRKFYDGAYQRGQGAVKRCLQRFSQFHQPISGWKKVAEMATKRGVSSGETVQ
ncbi:FAD-dependent monooxygenase [Lizonia empirigonia]|nr:FAD-dependent monooxygenase [Lizonia empirigonia]